MDEDGIPKVLKTERMGHEMPGMHGVYGHVSPAMRADLKTALQERWEGSLRERVRLSPRSIVPVLDNLLAAYRQVPAKIRQDPLLGSHKRRCCTLLLHHGHAGPATGAQVASGLARSEGLEPQPSDP
jgi:hypothetical protein